MVTLFGKAQGFYYHLTNSEVDAFQLATELVKWVEDHGFNPPIDDSLLSHDYWDHINLPSRPPQYRNWGYIPPTPEGEAYTAIVQQVRRAVQTGGDTNAVVLSNPASTFEFVLLFRYDKYGKGDNKTLLSWVDDLVKFYS